MQLAQPLVEIRLHGALAREFGKVWHLAVETVREAVQAIEANRPGFMAKIMELDKHGMVYRVRSKHHDYGEDDISCNLGSINRIDIIPIVRGASAGVRFVVGAMLVVASFYLPGGPVWAKVGQGMMMTGASLMLGAVVQWLTPMPDRQDMEDNSRESWTMSGPVNTVDQGLPVPIIYGEVLAGGYTVSAGLSAAQMNGDGVSGPVVRLGGNANPVARLDYVHAVTVELMLSASAQNMSDPLSYVWSYTGFAGATAVRMSGQGTATVKLQIDMPSSFVDLTTNGTVTCQVTGTKPGSFISQVLNTVTNTASQDCTVTVVVNPFGPGTPG